ncbi:MAG TPA: EAL domain-containing protein [Acidimicrobiales bacterium]|nr:EAL domain-containing protein [Acidimicrobiales bacterium]
MRRPSSGSRAGLAGSTFGRRFLTRLVDPANLTTIPVAAVFCLLRPVGLIAHIPYVTVVALLLAADLINTVAVAALPETPTGWRLTCRIGVEMAVIAAVVYGIGWGPLLAVGFVFGAADAMRASDSRAARQAVVFTVLFIGLGQLAIFLGLAPTLVRQPLVHGLGILGALGAVVTIKVIEWFAAAREAGEARFSTLVQHASDIVVVVDSNRCFSWVSPSFTRSLGWSVQDFEKRPAGELLHPDDHQKLFLQAASNRDGMKLLRSEIRLRHADGSWRWFDATVTDHLSDPRVNGVVANLHDVTERRELEDELRHQAFHDSLTGLANRALFTDRLEHALSRQLRSVGALAVLLVDLDDFKAINDSLGHGAGDALLTQASARLESLVRGSDTVARLGGDEFAILLEDPSEDDGPEQVADRIVAAFAEPIVVEDRPLALSASVGVALRSPGTSADELVRNADVAMYVAKASGKGRSVSFESGMHVATQRRLELKNGLLEAINSGDQMELHYQPVVDLRTREAVGVEALLRWNHPRHGLVPPLDFLPLAEESGLIVPLGRWVLREAVTQLSAWRAAHPELHGLTMSVNVSGRQLDEPRFVDEVRSALEDAQLDPALLVLEITESVLMRDRDDVVALLHELKGLGVGLAIDDFGTGYSSLGYLRSFPVDVLKVDRSFVSGITDQSRQAALAEAVLRMGATLELQTVAEGVELEEQAGQLEHLGCPLAQGFLFARPLPAPATEAVLLDMVGRTTPRAATV